MFGIEDQRHVHHFDVQLARLFAVQQVQEVTANRRFIAHALDALGVVAEAVPVAHDRREGGQQAVGLVQLLGEVFLRLQIAQKRATGAHHVHRVGVCGDAFQHFFQRLRQVAQGFQLGGVVSQLGFSRQFAVQQQVSHFFELGIGCQFTHVITPISEAGAFLTDRRQGCLPGHLAT